MGLLVTSLEVHDFRSYQRFDLRLDPAITVVLGPNAVGKTNLVEALQLLTSTESFRRPQWSEVVRWGAESSFLKMVAEGEGRHLEVSLRVSRQGRRAYQVNGKPRKKLVEVTGVLPCVVFTPDDLRLIKDSAERRRDALDSVGTQLSPSYNSLKSEYERTVRQRNALLRAEDLSESELEPWTQRLVEVGARFTEARLRLFSRMEPALREAHLLISGGSDLEASYVASWERAGVEETEPERGLSQLVARKRDEERARRVTLAGPHRDDISFKVQERDARTFASQGQQRTIALAWKLAEVSVVEGVSGQKPLLLLDDVMSELDEERRHALAAFVGTAAQTVVTTTNLGYFEDALVRKARVVRL